MDEEPKTRKRAPLRPRLRWEDIPAEERKAMTAEITKGFDGMKKLVDLPERAILALEAMARSQKIVAEFFANRVVLFKMDGSVYWGDWSADRRGRDNEKGATPEGGDDRRKPEGIPEPRPHWDSVYPPEDPRRCALPSNRYGWDSREGRAVCSIICPHNLTCPVPHRTIRDRDGPPAREDIPDQETVKQPAPGEGGRHPNGDRQ